MSPYLFILVNEILAKAIRSNVNIKGIFVSNEEIKISLCADDTTLILDGSKESLFYSLKMFDAFEKVPGLGLNDRKTEALWIGSSSIGNDRILKPGKYFTWPKSKVKALGLWIPIDPEYLKQKLEKVESFDCSSRLILLGKVTVLNALAVPQLCY